MPSLFHFLLSGSNLFHYSHRKMDGGVGFRRASTHLESFLP